jgi:MFS family permease
LTSVSTLVAMLAYSGPLGNTPTLTASLATSGAGTTWILSSMSIGLAVSLLTVGALADNVGRRRVFALGAWMFAAGSVLSAVATGPVLFVAGRLVEGVGAAGVVATGLGLATAVAAKPTDRAAVASWWGASMGVGIALGPVLTGLLDLSGQWRVFYWLLVVSGAVMALAASWSFNETTATSLRQVDLAGTGTMTTGLGLLVVALVEARQGSQAVAVSCGIAAVVCLTAFVITQIRGRTPMLEPALFRRRDFVAATVAALATGGGVIALMSFACTFLVTGMGMSTLGAGGLLALWSATSAVSAMLVRRLPTGFGGAWQLVIGLTGVAIGTLLLMGLSTASTPGRLVPGLLVTGVATGLLNTGLARQAVASVPSERAALGTGTNNTARYVGASLGVTIVSVIAAAPSHITAELMAGWNQAAVLTAGVSLAGALVVAVLSVRNADRSQSP